MVSRNNSLLRMEIIDAKELERALRELGQDRLIKATMKRALLKVGQPIAEHASRLAPRGKDPDKPRMADKIRVSTTLSKRQRRGRRRSDPTEAVVYIGAGPRGPGVLAEFGTGHRTWKNGKSTGSMPAQPFMRPAWEAGKDKALRDFSRELWDQIERSARRLAKRTAKAARG